MSSTTNISTKDTSNYWNIYVLRYKKNGVVQELRFVVSGEDGMRAAIELGREFCDLITATFCGVDQFIHDLPGKIAHLKEKYNLVA